MKKISLPSFIPIVQLQDRRSWFWEKIELPVIIVKLDEVLTKRGLLSEIAKKGLHDHLGFDGKIILSTVMPDEILDRLTIDDYFKLVDELKPDVAMVPDNYTYFDDPLYLSWSQTVKLINNSNAFLDLDLPVLGLCKGATRDQVYWTMKKQIEMGYVSFSFPVRELLRDNKDVFEIILSTVLQSLEEGKVDADLMLYGRSYKLRSSRKLSYANQSWFIKARIGGYFKGGILYDLRDPNVRFESCECKACKGRMPQDMIDMKDFVGILALHNLLDLSEKLGSE